MDRVAGLFILLYAQPLAAVERLTADRVRVGDAGVHVLFGDTPVRLVEPVAALVAKHLQTRRSRSIVGRRSPTPWLFPGAHPDRHRSESHLAARLKRLGIYARSSRHGALLELSAQLTAGAGMSASAPADVASGSTTGLPNWSTRTTPAAHSRTRQATGPSYGSLIPLAARR